jgi:hypothetical protein
MYKGTSKGAICQFPRRLFLEHSRESEVEEQEIPRRGRPSGIIPAF